MYYGAGSAQRFAPHPSREEESGAILNDTVYQDTDCTVEYTGQVYDGAEATSSTWSTRSSS